MDNIKKEYFSGSNVRVYFGGIYIEQLANIQYSLSEQVAPIYGFHSYTFDRVARGQRIVGGVFTLNFTENGYLQTILDRLASDVEGYREDSDTSAEVVTSEMATYNTEKTIERLLLVKDRKYEDYITDLKRSFWGAPTENGMIHQDLGKENDTYFYSKQGTKTNALREHGFNILIDYSPDANYSDFDRCMKNIHDGTSFYQTYRSIIGVHITGEQQAIGNDGSVIQTTYSFTARDLDGDITEASLSNNFRYDFEDIVIPSYSQLQGGAQELK